MEKTRDKFLPQYWIKSQTYYLKRQTFLQSELINVNIFLELEFRFTIIIDMKVLSKRTTERPCKLLHWSIPCPTMDFLIYIKRFISIWSESDSYLIFFAENSL